MHKKTIIKILFFLVLLTVFLLILISSRRSLYYISLEEVNNLTSKKEGKEILTSGKISQIDYYPGYQTIYLEGCKTPFIALSKDFINLNQGQIVIISGKLEKYNNNLQILISKITSVK